MLRHSAVRLGWRPKAYIQKVMPLLSGRAKVEFKLARRRVLGRLRRATNSRLQSDRFMNNSIRRAGINAAAREHGTDYARVTTDLARQDVAVHPAALKTLAINEPMSFRAVMELIASGIAPPTPPSEKPKEQLSMSEQLDKDVAAIKAKRSPLAQDTDLRHAWKRFVHETEK